MTIESLNLVLLVPVIILLLVLFFRKATVDLSPIQQSIQANEKYFERVESTVRDEIAKNRLEMSVAEKQSREEIAKTLKDVGDTLNSQLNTLTQNTGNTIDKLREMMEQRLQAMHQENAAKLDQIRQESSASSQRAREEVANALKEYREAFVASLEQMGGGQRSQLSDMIAQLVRLTESTEKKLEGQRIAIDAKLKQIQEESAANAKQVREETATALKGLSESLMSGMTGMTETQVKQMDGLKGVMETRLITLQENNAKQLEQMRVTVDEKLQGTLEKRLGESFKLVSERLEQVHKGLGEMQSLANGVGDLKKVLTNVKTRGTWGEVQLGAMLEQVLSPEQYSKNVATKEGGERVEFAVKLPGRSEDKQDIVWLPIDAKFPTEDYQRCVDAQEKCDAPAAEGASKQLEARIKQCAADISGKYINPPKTTDFGILYLPIEGLFAEVLHRPGLTEILQREHRVIVAGPTTLWSLLNSLQMGFKTLAIEKRSSEVWTLLSAIKTEWGKYEQVLDKVQKKLQEASSTIDDVQIRQRAVGRKLRGVHELPVADAQKILAIEANVEAGVDDTADA